MNPIITCISLALICSPSNSNYQMASTNRVTCKQDEQEAKDEKTFTDTYLEVIEERQCLIHIKKLGNRHPLVITNQKSIDALNTDKSSIVRKEIEERLVTLNKERQELLKDKQKNEEKLKENAVRILAIAKYLATN